MNKYLTVALSMLAGVVLGAITVNALHAQGEPPAFVISEVTVKDQAHYLANFIPAVRRTVGTAGAEVVVHGGKLQTLLGAAPASIDNATVRYLFIAYPSLFQLVLMSANLITFAHFAAALTISAPNCGGVIVAGSAPIAMKCARIAGSATMALMLLLSVSMIAAGVAFGAPIAAQPLPS